MYHLIGVIEEVADLVYVKDLESGGVEVYRYDPLINARIKLGSSYLKYDDSSFKTVFHNKLHYETKVCTHAQKAENEYAIIVGYILWAGIKRSKEKELKKYNFDQYIKMGLHWLYNDGAIYRDDYRYIVMNIIVEKAEDLFEPHIKGEVRKRTLSRRLEDRIKYLKKEYKRENAKNIEANKRNLEDQNNFLNEEDKQEHAKDIKENKKDEQE